MQIINLSMVPLPHMVHEHVPITEDLLAVDALVLVQLLLQDFDVGHLCFTVISNRNY